MPVTAGPIYPGIKKGLVFAIDPANKDSWAGPTSDTVNSLVSYNFFTGSIYNDTSGSYGDNESFAFDGTDDYIKIGDVRDFDNGDLSVSIWTNVSSTRTSTVYAFSNCGSTSYAGFDIAIKTNEQVRLRRNTRTQINDPGWVSIGLTEDTWNNISFTYNESTNTLKLFLNGVLKNTTTGTSQSAAVSRVLTIGSYIGTISLWNGNIGPAQIYNRTLSASEVLENYNRLKGRFGLS